MNIDKIIADIMDTNFVSPHPLKDPIYGIQKPEKDDCHESYVDNLIKKESDSVLLELKKFGKLP